MENTSVKLLMDKITRHPLLKDVPFETVIDYTVDFIKIMGIPPTFLEKTEIIQIDDYRGVLPCDYYDMIQVRDVKTNKTFRYSTDSFHMSPNKGHSVDLTYKIQRDVIFTSLEKGDIEISYKAIEVDEDGFPTLPDNSSFVRALELYVKKKWFTVLFDLGKINISIMNKTDQDYAWAVNQCKSDMILPTIDKMQSFTNMWNTLIPRYYEHSKGFINAGTKESLIIH